MIRFLFAAFFLVLLSSHAHADYSFVGKHGDADFDGSNNAAQTVAGVAASLHNTAIVEFGYGSATRVTETVTDGTNTYDYLTTILDGSYARAVFVCKDMAAGTFTVSGNLAVATPYTAISVVVYDGLDNSATPQYSTAVVTNSGTGTDAASSGNITPAGQPAMVYGLVADGLGADVAIVGTSFTSRGPIPTWDGGTLSTMIQDRRITSTSAVAATFTETTGTNRLSISGLVILEPVVGGPSAPPAGMLLRGGGR